MKKLKKTAKKITKKTTHKKAAKKVVKKQTASIMNSWQSETLAYMRSLIEAALPGVKEELKWRGVPVWYYDGIICTGETYKDKVKLTFFKGAKIKDPKKLFNASLEGNARRAIDIKEGEKINAADFKKLMKEAAALNA